MKAFVFLAVALCWISIQARGQVSVNTDGSLPDPAAMLDVKSIEKGFLPPRLTTQQISQIPSPPAGLMVFNTDSGRLNLFDGTNWHELAPGICIPSPSTANAGPDQATANDTVTLAANIPEYGTGIWTIISGTGGVLSDPADPAAQFSGLPMTSYVLRWTISNGCGSSQDDILINFMNFDDAVFVSTTGSNTNPGTQSQPFLTVSYAITNAQAQGKHNVDIAAGTYGETVTLISGICLYGGFDPATWARNASIYNTTVNGGVKAITGSGVSNVTIDGINIHGADAPTYGVSAYGIFLSESTGVCVNHCSIDAGHGSQGLTGSTGSSGYPGGNGGQGVSGCENSTWPCTSCSRPPGGFGGSSATGATGGTGGYPGLGPDIGYPGGYGGGANGGAGGSGGTINNSICTGYKVPSYAANGFDGQNGLAGTNGLGGLAFGFIQATGYDVANGASGSTGTNGGGGGGGGGGRGGTLDCDSYGSSGGGGGGGGQRGNPGLNGGGGGGSFAIYCYNSSVTVTGCTIITTGGGAGGSGGAGGAGAAGGTGGAGGPYDPDQDDAGCGGWGGDGGDGGRGGHGGGGGGGPSFGILKNAGSTVTQSGNTFQIGPAGTGGSSQGNPGLTGTSGSMNF